MGKLVDLTGQRFGRWTVLRRAGLDAAGKNATWLCQCDCGNKKIVTKVALTSGHSKSCGCYCSEVSKQLIKPLHERHRDEYPKIERLFRIWIKMRNRCYNPQNDGYKNYGGRGIDICLEWSNFYEFQEWALNAGYSPDLTLDRINVNGNYCPENCRWVSIKRQSRNKRKTIYLTLDGVRKPMADWADEIGISWRTLHSRYVRGWSDERILTTPVQKHK